MYATLFEPNEIALIKEALSSTKSATKKERVDWDSIKSSIDSKRLADYGFIVTKAANTVLLKEKDTSKEMYFILEGEVKVTVGNTEIATIGPGQFFGEMSMVDGLPRSATVATTTECRLIEIDAKNFETIIRAEPSIAVRLLETVIKRFRAQNEILSQAIWRGGKEQL
jgi:CRP-like cAMP-binding protein